MKTRKLVLLIADAVLLAVCILQGVFAFHDTTKYFELKDTPDEILIDTPEEKGITVTKEDGKWFVAKQKYPADENIVNSFVDAMSSIRVLDKVGTTGNDAILEKYELNDSRKTTVVVKKEGKVLRTIEIGKKAMSDTQSYITVDGGKDIYLATGNLADTFDTITSAIRSEQVMALNASEITGITVIDAEDNSWTVSRMGNGDDVVWNISGAEVEVDSEKAATWFNSIANLRTKTWYGDNEKPDGTKVLTLKISYAFQTTTLDFYVLPLVEGSQQEYFAKCSETPYLFKVQNSVFEKYAKTAEDLAK